MKVLNFVFVLWLSKFVIAMANKFHEKCEHSCQNSYFDHFPSPATTANFSVYETKQKENYPTVDIFFLFLNGKAEYIHRGYFWILPHIATQLSMFNNHTSERDTRIHIVSDNSVVLHNATRAGYNAHDLHDYKLNYIHLIANIKQSVTSFEYEITLYRWRIYADIMHKWNSDFLHVPMKRILSLDGDVLMLKNPAVWFNDVLLALTKKEHHFTNSNGVLTVDDSFYDIINISLGAVGLFSERGLLSFASYIDNWFLNDNAGTHNTIHADATHAKKDKSRYGKYLSDMMLQREFISLNTTVSNNCYEFMKGKSRGSGDYHSVWRLEEENQCLVKALGCVPMSNYQDMAKDHDIGVYNYTDRLVERSYHKTSTVGASDSYQLYVRETTEMLPYCLMHFQGAQSKKLLYVYGKIFDYFHFLSADEKSSAPHSFLSVDDHMQGGMFLEPKGSSAVYHINDRGHKRLFNSWKELIDTGLDPENIIKHVPLSLLHVFPTRV